VSSGDVGALSIYHLAGCALRWSKSHPQTDRAHATLAAPQKRAPAYGLAANGYAIDGRKVTAGAAECERGYHRLRGYARRSFSCARNQPEQGRRDAKYRRSNHSRSVGTVGSTGTNRRGCRRDSGGRRRVSSDRTSTHRLRYYAPSRRPIIAGALFSDRGRQTQDQVGLRSAPDLLSTDAKRSAGSSSIRPRGSRSWRGEPEAQAVGG